MDVGLSSSNTRRYINISLLASTLVHGVVDSLPGFHAFTGSDVTAAFMNKGKIRPFELLGRHQDHMATFSTLGESEIIPHHIFVNMEKFVCALYGKAHICIVWMM